MKKLLLALLLVSCTGLFSQKNGRTLTYENGSLCSDLKTQTMADIKYEHPIETSFDTKREIDSLHPIVDTTEAKGSATTIVIHGNLVWRDLRLDFCAVNHKKNNYTILLDSTMRVIDSSYYASKSARQITDSTYWGYRPQYINMRKVRKKNLINTPTYHCRYQSIDSTKISWYISYTISAGNGKAIYSDKQFVINYTASAIYPTMLLELIGK